MGRVSLAVMGVVWASVLSAPLASNGQLRRAGCRERQAGRFNCPSPTNLVSASFRCSSRSHYRIRFTLCPVNFDPEMEVGGCARCRAFEKPKSSTVGAALLGLAARKATPPPPGPSQNFS